MIREERLLAVQRWLQSYPEVISFQEWSGQQSVPLDRLASAIRQAEINGIIEPGQSCIDLGSSVGNAVFLFAAAGYSTTGYELSEEAITIARERGELILEAEERGLEVAEFSFFHQSYFPREYIDFRSSGDSLAVRLEAEIEGGLVFDKPGVITPEQLAHYDIFYTFPYDVQMPSIFELFDLYANDDAVLFAIEHQKDHVVYDALRAFGGRVVRFCDPDIFAGDKTAQAEIQKKAAKFVWHNLRCYVKKDFDYSKAEERALRLL